MGGYAWVTLATNDLYSLGALVLAHSLKRAGTAHQLAVLITPGVTNAMRQRLSSVFDVVKQVDVLDSNDRENLQLLKRPELGVTFTKLSCWRLTQFDKCVFLDADTLILQNADELFEREQLSAAPDVGWPDCFNSGVFVYRPSEDTYHKLVEFAIQTTSFDGADQGLLNLFFNDWAHSDIGKHLPFIYNVCSTACYSYLPAFKRFNENIKIIHFIGNSKPWLQYFDVATKQVRETSDLGHLHGLLQFWWDLFCSNVHSSLSTEMAPGRSSTVNCTSISCNTSPPLYSFQNVAQNVEYWIAQSDTCSDPRDPWDEYENKKSEFDKNAKQNTSFIPEPHSRTKDDLNFESECKYSEIIISKNDDSREICGADESDNFIARDNRVCSPFKSTSSLTDDSPYIPTISNAPADYIPSECNQLNWSDECEKISCVTKEIALQNNSLENRRDSSAGLAGAFAQLTLGVSRTTEQDVLEDQLRRQNWESGNIDYLGRDSFDNIWSKICQTLAAPAVQDNPITESNEPSTIVSTESVEVELAEIITASENTNSSGISQIVTDATQSHDNTTESTRISADSGELVTSTVSLEKENKPQPDLEILDQTQVTSEPDTDLQILPPTSDFSQVACSLSESDQQTPTPILQLSESTTACESTLLQPKNVNVPQSEIQTAATEEKNKEVSVSKTEPVEQDEFLATASQSTNSETAQGAQISSQACTKESTSKRPAPPPRKSSGSKKAAATGKSKK